MTSKYIIREDTKPLLYPAEQGRCSIGIAPSDLRYLSKRQQVARPRETMISQSIIDDLRCDPPLSTVETRWQLFSDQVMGGVSSATMVREEVAGRPAVRMRGDVSLENNGGFVQIALDLAPGGKAVDANAWQGIELDVFGNGQQYNVHLRTEELRRPWQSYRQTFRAEPRWQTVQFRFQTFVPHRTDTPLDVRRLKRIGVVAIDRAFAADLAVGGLRYFL